jgi:hypothetical protein
MHKLTPFTKDEDLRIHALELANASTGHNSEPYTVVGKAAIFYDFLKNSNTLHTIKSPKLVKKK